MSDLAPPPAPPPPAVPGSTSPPPAPPAEPGHLGKAGRLARTVVEATFTPRRFLGRWEAEPARYASPLELLSVNGLLVGGVVYLAHQFSSTLGDQPAFADLVATSRAAGMVLDGVNALMPLVAVWGQVLAIRVAAAVVRADGGWPRAVRQAGFLAAYYVPVTAVSMVVLAAAGSTGAGPFAAVAGASLLLEVGYSALGFSRLYGRGPGRALLGAVVGMVGAVILQQAYVFLGAAVVVATGLALPK